MYKPQDLLAYTIVLESVVVVVSISRFIRLIAHTRNSHQTANENKQSSYTNLQPFLNIDNNKIKQNLRNYLFLITERSLRLQKLTTPLSYIHVATESDAVDVQAEVSLFKILQLLLIEESLKSNTGSSHAS